jgi:HK97 family phage major capsid protein
MSVLTDKQGRIAHLQKEWLTLWESKPDRKFTSEEADNLKNWNTEMSDLRVEVEQLVDFEDIAKGIATAHDVKGGTSILGDDNKGDRYSETRLKSTREIIEQSAEFKAFRERGGGTFTLNFGDDTAVKTLLTLSDAAPQATRLARVEPYPVERRTAADMMMQGTMDGNVLEYYEETTFTNAAAETAEGSAKPEAALDWTLRTETASKIAVWIPATSESLADVSWLRSTIQNRLVFMLRRREEAQLLNGDGTAPNISGITDRSGLQTQAKGSDPTPDAILKAANLIRVNSFYEPDGVVIDPLDMQDIRLLRTADGIYIFGSPSDPYTAIRLWGMEVRETTAQTDNTAIVGAFGTAAQVFRRSGITVTASTEHASYFVENKVAILAEERLALAVYRPNAFCTVTGI